MAMVVAASAQVPSLANVGDDVYTSTEDGFEIAIPDTCVKISDGEAGRSYNCEIKEGLVLVMINEEDSPIKTDAELAGFLQGFKDGLINKPGVKLFGETSSKIGDYRGAAYQITIDGDKTLAVALAWEKFTVVVLGKANSKIAGSAELISKAVQSFTFVSPVKK